MDKRKDAALYRDAGGMQGWRWPMRRVSQRCI
jgi:hypothetical protein